MKASRSACVMQSFNPTPAAFEHLCRGIVRDEAATVQRALLSTTSATIVSWLKATDTQGHNLLQHAAHHGHLAAIQPILGLQFSVKLPVDSRLQFVALLKSAAPEGNPDLQELLQQHIQSHKDICAVSTSDNSCPILYQAARLGDSPALQQLLSGGTQDSLIESPATPSTAATSAGHCTGVYTPPTDAPRSALEAAIKVGSVPMVQQLLAASTPAQLSAHFGFSALSYAVKNSASLQMVQMLLTAGAAIMDSSKTLCVLTAAVSHASFEVTGSIFAAAQRAQGSGNSSSSTGLPTSVMHRALMSAVTIDRADVAELLLQSQDPAAAQLLLNHAAAADVDTAPPLAGYTPLHAAIIMSSTSTAVMKVLLDAGADSRIKSDGRTALQHAMQCAIRGYSSTAPFECLLSHSRQPLSAAELVSTAWSLAGSEHWGQRMRQYREQQVPDHNMPAWDDSSDEEDWPSDEEWADEVAAQKQAAQHSMLCSLLRTAAAKDSTAAEAALTACRQQIQDLYEEAQSNYDGAEGCTCGCCQPEAINPDLILRARMMLRAMSDVWLNSPPIDLAAQRNAVQHMLVSATASLKQLQLLQRQHQAEVAAQAASMADREAVLALREQQLAEREQQVVCREHQVRAREQQLEK